MKKQAWAVVLVTLVALLATIPATATPPSGNGQTTSAKSVSVVVASDQGTTSNPLRTTAPDRTTFTLTHFETNNSGLATDTNDPNTTDPASRAVRLTQSVSATTGAGATSILGVALDGTSLVVQPWIYDDVRLTWYKLGPTVTVNSSSVGGTSLGTIGAGLVGAKFFFQITTNTGTVTKFYWYFR